MNKLILALVLGVFLLNVEHSFAHNPNVVSLRIVESETGWTGMVSYGTYGLEQLIAKSTGVENYTITDSDSCHSMLIDFIKNNLSIELNKFALIEFDDVQLSITGHAVEFEMNLINIPVRAEFWSVQFKYSESNLHIQHAIEFISNEKQSKFILESSSIASFRKDEQGRFEQLITKKIIKQ